MQVWNMTLNKVEVLLKAGRYQDALNLLRSDPNLYSFVVTRMIQALESYPGGKIADLNGNVWSTKQLADMLKQGKWLPVHFNFLLGEIDVIRRELGG